MKIRCVVCGIELDYPMMRRYIANYICKSCTEEINKKLN